MVVQNSDAVVNFTDVSSTLKEICSNCNLEGDSSCNKSQCLNGFALIVADYYEAKGSLNIAGAETLIPKNDFKVYDKDLVAPAIAETCKLCRQCRDNHTDDCVIALIRNSMEMAFWGDSLPYPGNIIEYLTAVKQKDPELASYILSNYKKVSR